MVVYKKDGVIGTRICTREWMEYIKLEFEPNCEIAPHIVNSLVDFYVIKGSGTISINGRDISVTADSLVSVSPGANRGITSGNEGVLILVIKHLNHED